jgi:large repetitive protein
MVEVPPAPPQMAANTLTDVSPGTYNVTASATNYKTLIQSASVNPGQTTTLNFALSPLIGGIKGKAQTTGGKPIAGATITVMGGVEPTTQTMTTDTLGQYSFPRLPVGSYTVTAAKSLYITQSKTTSVSSNTSSTVNFILKLSH